MNWSVRLNRSKAADFIIAMLAMTPAVAIYYASLSHDAAVYFTFIRNFFDLPFSYQPGTVSFGATSPLHVMIHAPIYAVLGEHWLPVSKFINLLFVTFGVVCINRALRGGTKTVLLISLLVAVSTALLVSAAQLFETGLSFLALAWLYHDLVHKKHNRAAVVSGLLYLIRPELIFVTLAVLIYILVHSEERKRIIIWTAVAFIPAIMYHVYMLANTGSPLPGSAFSPIITYIQDPTSWLQRLGITFSSLWSTSGLIYIAGGVVALLLIAERAAGRYSQEFLLIAPLVGLYFIFPPQEEIARYLVPIVPLTIAIIVRYVQQDLKMQYTVNALVVCLVLAHGYGIAARTSIPGHNRSAMLLQDLSTGLNDLAGNNSRILLEDIQGQYYIDAPCYSLDASVGNEMLDVLLKRSSMKDFIQNHQVEYLVTGDAAGRADRIPIQLLAELNQHDYVSELNDTVMIDGIAFRKAISNPNFVKRKALARAMALEGHDRHNAPVKPSRWNSVYTVLGDEATIRAEMLAAQQQMAVVDTLATEVSGEPVTEQIEDQPAEPAAEPNPDLPPEPAAAAETVAATG